MSVYIANDNFSNRNVFLGLAQDKLNKNAEAEQAYLAATRIKGDDRTAWQGLINLYQKQGSYKLDSYREAVLKLGQVYAEVYESRIPFPPFSIAQRKAADVVVPAMTRIAAKIW